MTELLDITDSDLVSHYEHTELDEQMMTVLASVEETLEKHFYDAPKVIAALRSAIRHFVDDSNTEFLGRGTTRMCFSYGEDQVIKIPLTWRGIADSESEEDSYKTYTKTGKGIPTAACSFIEFDNGNLSLLVMERLHSFPADNDALPAWTDFVDCCQVGYNSIGELVAYDL